MLLWLGFQLTPQLTTTLSRTGRRKLRTSTKPRNMTGLRADGGEKGPVTFPAFKAGDPALRGSDGGFDSHTLPPYLFGIHKVTVGARRQKAAIRKINPVHGRYPFG